MVPDGLIWIKNPVDPPLAFRRSCREGVCGSCAMNIGGRNTLACTHRWGGGPGQEVQGSPPPPMPGVEDLGAGLTQFFAQEAPHQPLPDTPKPGAPQEMLPS